MFLHLFSYYLPHLTTINFLYESLKITLIVITSYTSYYYFKYFTRENPLPGPFPLPLIGNIHQVFKNSSLDVKEIHAKYGDLCEISLGSQRCILVTDQTLAQKIFRPIIRGPFQNSFKDDVEGFKEVDILNHGLLANNNNFDEWNYHRRFFNKVILSSQFARQSVNVVRNNFSEMSKYWDELGEDKILEFNHWMKRYFFDTIFITSASKSAYAMANYYNKLNPDNELTIPESTLKESDMFIESVDALVKSVVYFLSVPRIVRNFPGINIYTQKLKDKVNWLRNNIESIIRSKRTEISKTQIDQLTPDILTLFLTVNAERDFTDTAADDPDKPMSDEDVQSNFMFIMAGGIDTSANSMCFIVYYLENNPRVKQKMIEEIERVLGKDPDSLFTFEDLLKLEYVEAVIKEASRHKTLFAGILRINSVPEVVGDHKWSKETTFWINVMGIHHHKSYWKDPNAFNPERFLEDPESNHYIYMFGGGLRKCPGRNLAMMELKATLVMLYRKYNIELMGPLKEHTSTIRQCNELKARLIKRKDL